MPLKIFFSCSLGGGGRYFAVPSNSEHSQDRNGPKWSILVHFGLKRSILVHLGPPTVLWPLLKIEKTQIREATLKKASFQYRMKCSIESAFFVQSQPLSGRTKASLALNISSENENVKPRMKFSSENGSFVRRRTNVQKLTCNIDLSCSFYYLSSLLFSLS